MAIRNIATSDTLETFRTEFNAEAINLGDIATLDSNLTATTIVGSVNEIYSTAIVGKKGGTNFTGSLLIGSTTTGTLSNADRNVGIGTNGGLWAITQGDDNVAVGYQSSALLTTGSKNTAIGSAAGYAIATTNENTTIGYVSGIFGVGNYNTLLGSKAGHGLLAADYNTLLGKSSGANITTGDGNVIIGTVNAASATGDRQLKIAGYDGTTTTTWITGDSSGNVTFPATVTATTFSGDGSSLSGITSLANNAVTEAKIADNAVTEAKIADNAVTQAQMADDAIGYDELQNVQSLIIYASAPTTATANCNGAISSSTALVVDGNSGTIAVGMIVSGTGVETTNPPSVITVTDQNNLVLSHAQTIANDVALTFTQSLKILRTAGDA